MRTPKAALAILLGALPVSLAAGAADEEWDAPSKKWIKGPASYLVTDNEEKEFKRTGEADCAAFVQGFWARRDPNPDTPENEFRDRFLARVAAADEILKAEGIPAGWKSEPGKVLILLGQPDDFKRESLEAGGAAGLGDSSGPSRYDGSGGVGAAGPTGGGDSVKLLVEYRDATRLGLPEKLELEFRGDGQNFRLMTRVDLGTDAIRGLDREFLAAEFPAGAVAVEQLSLKPLAPAPTPAPAGALAGDLTAPQRLLMEALEQVPPAEEMVSEDAAIDFYKTLAGKTYVAITLATEEAAGGAPALHPVAALRDVSNPDNLYLYDSDDLFAPADAGGEDGILRFQAGDGMDPGTYRVATGFLNDDGSVARMATRQIVIPDFEVAGVAVSTLALVAGHTETTEEGGGDLKRPYILGNRKVVPKVRPRFAQDGTVTVYYQVYNATEGGGGEPDLRISYKVYQKRGDRYVRAAVVPPLEGVTNRVQIYELQITPAWRPGDYKLKVTVEDNLGGSFAEGEVAFQVG